MSDLYTLFKVLDVSKTKMKILGLLDRYFEHVFKDKLCARKDIDNVAEWTLLSSYG